MKYKSSTSLLISVALHLMIGIIGFFFWFSTVPSHDADSIDAIFTAVEEPKTKRITPPKRPQIRHQTSQNTSQPQLKILTSNQPVTHRGVVSAEEPTAFEPLEKVNLGEGFAPGPAAIKFEGAPRIQRGVEQPIKKQKKVPERIKSRLVKFIEAQEGPQRIVYCVDLSASMQNLQDRKLKKVVDIMRDSLTFLELHDSFNIMAFSTELIAYQNKFVSVTEETVDASSVYLSDIKSQIRTKGTDHDMLTVLTETAKTSPTIVVLFSDGIPTSITQPDLTLIGKHAEGNGKVFAMGIGMAPNFPGAVMLKQLSIVSKGDFWLVDR
ncbi:MAG: VWA domain-containing protein [Candidatus Poribacteria bacterium]|nr:VWA domain-containing protein [Candidatus Poribacteria bacterium]